MNTSVIGTVEKKVWQEGLNESMKMETIGEHAADIKEYMTLGYEPGG